ncbi:MAG TPA: four helix bundle protein [Chryseosolibacter sp.]|nr:four helix bundle protein [Chryseosolibacter sp.]
MEYVDHFMDLEVYKLVRQLSIRIFEITKTFPKAETYALTDQVRRSSRSIGGQIAEAWGKRDYERHFISKLTDADGEQLETQHWLRTSMDCSYITDEVGNPLLGDYQLLGKMIYTMILKAPSFCSSKKKKKGWKDQDTKGKGKT